MASRTTWRKWLPWEGPAAPADYALLIAIAVVVAIGLVSRPLIPFLIARQPVALELVTGDLFAVGVAAAFARIGELPLWLAILAGVIGMKKFDWISWWAGRRWGEGMIRVISTPEQARRWTTRARGSSTGLVCVMIILASLPGVPSAIVFAIAGMHGIRLTAFMALDALGALMMTTLVAGLGFTIGQSAVDVVLLVDRYASAVSITIIGLAVAIPLAKRAYRRRRALQGRLRRRPDELEPS